MRHANLYPGGRQLQHHAVCDDQYGDHGATIQYTIDGTAPSETNGTIFSAPLMVGSNCTLQAIAYNTGMLDSPVISAAYVLQGAPIFTPPAGSYLCTTLVSITPAISGMTINYTTDGTTPSETVGTIYCTPLSFTTTTTLQAIAYGNGMPDSPVAIAVYTPVGFTLQPPPGTYQGAQQVSITSGDGSTIYFTLDGTTPTPTTGIPYSGPIVIAANTILHLTTAAAWNNNPMVASAAYRIQSGTDDMDEQMDEQMMAPAASQAHNTTDGMAGQMKASTVHPIRNTFTFTPPFTIIPASGSYIAGTTAYITVNSNDLSPIYYTLDGSIPDPASASTLCGGLSIIVPITSTTTLLVTTYDAWYYDGATPYGTNPLVGEGVYQFVSIPPNPLTFTPPLMEALPLIEGINPSPPNGPDGPDANAAAFIMTDPVMNINGSVACSLSWQEPWWAQGGNYNYLQPIPIGSVEEAYRNSGINYCSTLPRNTFSGITCFPTAITGDGTMVDFATLTFPLYNEVYPYLNYPMNSADAVSYTGSLDNDGVLSQCKPNRLFGTFCSIDGYVRGSSILY